ncbi:MAG: membrane protein [Ardenticatenaceae bacterium]|nr:MAG: membrane protein [Ardenticatenaceae bacterium]
MKLSERALKDQLYDIADNEFALPEQANGMSRALEMLPHLGSADAELRDELIYSTLATWMLADKFEDDDLKTLLKQLITDAHLFYQVGESGTDSVFMRSFSVLLVPLVLSRHRERPFLMPYELRELKVKLLDYLEREQDLRGFILDEDEAGEPKGWAHAVAHTADALDELVQCKEMGSEELLEVLDAVRQKAAEATLVFVHLEDERLVTPVISTLGRKLLTPADVQSWLNGFVPLAQQKEPFPDCYRQAQNVKNFLRSLYFRALKPETAVQIGENSASALADLVGKTLQKIALF